ncbi:uncharacterized protein LOC124445710 [Xenia sp. Carnegie-2017]|uniref:uncharacterized protein LOC124445710 n=1 Tax=Xenia sp. Carnegie-2017 TaxID=2897299 RepID=UPI001F039811|nr:uncharacterized protein LOC124445710 [Xenia sp. Carnegie-2017]
MANASLRENIELISDKANNDEKSLPFVDKLQLLDKEIRLLQECCLKMGLNSKEIELCAEPLLEERHKESRKRWWRRVLYISALVAFIAFIFWFDPTYRYICIFGRLSSMKLLPYWDWTKEFQNDCFIENPYYVEETLTEEECEICVKVKGTRVRNVSQDAIANKYLYNAIPVIVIDTTEHWPAHVAKIDLDALEQTYLDEKDLDVSKAFCSFDAFSQDIESPLQLLSMAKNKELRQWQGYWENCKPSLAKKLRKFYQRPYFLPPMAEASPENWIFVSDSDSKKSTMKWEEIEFSSSATWLTQIKGQSSIVLTPNPPCDEICKKMSTKLKAGESILFENRIWGFKRRPIPGELSISLASTLRWDEL